MAGDSASQPISFFATSSEDSCREFTPQQEISSFPRSLPYLAATAWAIFLWFLRKNRIDSYPEFLENSPGIDVKTAGIKYGTGHPTEVPAEPPAAEPENPPVAQPWRPFFLILSV
jgi:hypothetical protein